MVQLELALAMGHCIPERFRLNRTCRCNQHNLLHLRDTIRCHPAHSLHSPLRTCSTLRQGGKARLLVKVGAASGLEVPVSSGLVLVLEWACLVGHHI